MTWMLIVAAVWTLLAAPMAVLVGCMIRQGDERERASAVPAVPDFPPAHWTSTGVISR